jgi:hypothetical protein
MTFNSNSSSSFGSVRGIFGVAAKPQPATADSDDSHEPSAPAVGDTPLDLDIGGEGGYFDHDEVRALDQNLTGFDQMVDHVYDPAPWAGYAQAWHLVENLVENLL